MTTQQDRETRRFLFLQGPHGPFFGVLARALRQTGAKVWRVGFNAGDEAFWRGPGYLPFHGSLSDWPDTADRLLAEHRITDLVCYGGSRPVHRTAVEMARKRGVTIHVFEEGYLRPHWITYERNGTNADSEIVGTNLEQMDWALKEHDPVLTEPPDRWGDMRAHMFWGAAYHGRLLAGTRRYPGYRPHRAPNVTGEFLLHVKKLGTLPAQIAARWVATHRVRFGGYPFHVVLLQLAHDANFRDNGPFDSQAEFLAEVFEGFAKGAPSHHHLVLKAHPLEDGREPLRPLIRRLATEHGLLDRVHFISGGKLARILRLAKSAVTVNSTAAEQALWRGLPLKAFGAAVYNRPEFVSDQQIADFFSAPRRPDRTAYLTYRAFLLATSQVPGGFYAFRSRRKLMRQLPDLMLDQYSPTHRLLANTDAVAAGPQHLRVVK